MKRTVFFCIFISAIISICAGNSAYDAQIRLMSHLGADTANVEIYEYGYISKGESIKMLRETMFSEHEGYLFFIDDDPLANWDHDCRYIWVGTEKISELKGTQPPYLVNWDKIKSLPSCNPKSAPSLSLSRIMEKIVSDKSQGRFFMPDNKYAVILNGGAKMTSNHIRYWNDCSAIFTVLKDLYGYRQENICVLMSDGTSPANDRCVDPYTYVYDSSPLDFNGDGINDIRYSATINNLRKAFDELSAKLAEDDELFVFVTDHGFSQDGHSYINLWNGETIRDDEFAALFDNIRAGSVSIVMEQCYSGGFIDDFDRDNFSIATACSADEVSYSMPGGSYDEFVYHWISAVAYKDLSTGNKIQADTDLNGFVSMGEAFRYAERNDARNENPQYKSLPGDWGDKTTVDPDMFLSLEGADVLCDEGIYSVSNVNPLAEVYWSFGEDDGIFYPFPPLKIIEGQGTSQATFKRGSEREMLVDPDLGVIKPGKFVPYVGTQQIKATVKLNGGTYTLEKDVTMKKIYTPDITGAAEIGDVAPPGMSLALWFQGQENTLTSKYGGPEQVMYWYYSNVIWEIVHPNGQTESRTGMQVNITPASVGRLKVTVTDRNQCHLGNSYTAEYPIHGVMTRMRHANPASGMVEINVVNKIGLSPDGASPVSAAPAPQPCEEPYDGPCRLELWHDLHGLVRSLDITGGSPTVTMDLSGLAPGLYHLRLITGGELADISKLVVR